ncbi:MAG: hypothetical protein Roseis2KO_44130 [Roseivirga sp.]
MAQDEKLSGLRAKYLNAKPQEKSQALSDYIRALVREDRLAADSLMSDYFETNSRQDQNINWPKLYQSMADVKYQFREYEIAQTYLDSALLILMTAPEIAYVDLAKTYDLKGIIFQRYRTYDSATFYFTKALANAEKGDSKEVLAKVHNTIGTNHWYMGQYASALKAYNQALEIRKTLQDSSGLAESYRNMGLTYRVIGDYATALQYYEKALPLFARSDNQRGTANLLNSMGVLYKELSDYDQALEFHKRSMQIRKDQGDSLAWSYSLDNIGSAHIQKGNFGQAIEVLLLAEQLKEGEEADVSMYNTLSNIGICYDKLEQHPKAISYFNRALTLAEAVKKKRAMIMVYNNLNQLYNDEGDHIKALQYALTSLTLSQEINTPEALAISHEYLSKTYKALGRFSEALAHSESQISYEKQLFDEKAAEEKSRMLVNYDFANQQRELEDREAKLIDINEQSELLRARQLILLVVVLALLLVIVLLIFTFRTRLTKSRLEQDLITQKAQLVELSKQNLDQQLELKELELTAYAEQLSQKNELIATFKQQFVVDRDKDLQDIAGSVEGRSMGSTSWEEFRLRFDQVHGHFIPRLNELHHDLTNNELNISILLRLNLSNKDMASILGTTYDSVKKSVQRLYKKVGRENADDLRGYLLKI